MREVSLDRILDQSGNQDPESSKRVHFAADANNLDNLKLELQNREETITSLQNEIKTLKSNYEQALNGV